MQKYTNNLKDAIKIATQMQLDNPDHQVIICNTDKKEKYLIHNEEITND